MRISTVLSSAALLLLTATVVYAPNAFAQATTVQQVTQSVTDNNMVIQSYKENDYGMYVKATGGVSNDAIHVRFNKERNAYLSDTTVKPAVVTTTTTTSSNEEMKIQSYKENDYGMYVKASGGVSNDETHVRFNAERDAYLGKTSTTSTPPVVPATNSSNDETMKIKSYMDYDYVMYVKATGGVSNDTVHIRFNSERDAYLKANNITPVQPSTQEGVQKPNKPRPNVRNNVRNSRSVMPGKNKTRKSSTVIIIHNY